MQSHQGWGTASCAAPCSQHSAAILQLSHTPACSLGRLGRVFKYRWNYFHILWVFLLVVLLSLLSSAQERAFKSRDWIFPGQMVPSSSPQLPALAQDAFHCPKPSLCRCCCHHFAGHSKDRSSLQGQTGKSSSSSQKEKALSTLPPCIAPAHSPVLPSLLAG